jgi:hypothetical protein
MSLAAFRGYARLNIENARFAQECYLGLNGPGRVKPEDYLSTGT